MIRLLFKNILHQLALAQSNLIILSNILSFNLILRIIFFNKKWDGAQTKSNSCSYQRVLEKREREANKKRE